MCFPQRGLLKDQTQTEVTYRGPLTICSEFFHIEIFLCCKLFTLHRWSLFTVLCRKYRCHKRSLKHAIFQPYISNESFLGLGFLILMLITTMIRKNCDCFRYRLPEKLSSSTKCKNSFFSSREVVVGVVG